MLTTCGPKSRSPEGDIMITTPKIKFSPAISFSNILLLMAALNDEININD
jgi:hypothetical protein